MPEEFEPRENDHLVEPMFEALRAGIDDGGEKTRGGGAAGWLPWLLVVLLVGIVGVVIVALRGCGADGAS